MFRCERCGTGFNPTVAAFTEGCPRCKARDGVTARVSFRLFERAQLPASGTNPVVGRDRPSDVEVAEDHAAARTGSLKFDGIGYREVKLDERSSMAK